MNELHQTLLSQEPIVRLVSFLGVLAILVGAEFLWPRRSDQPQRVFRWVSNFGLVFLNTMLVRLILPGSVMAVAFWAESRGVGLVRWTGTDSNHWAMCLGSVIFLDLVIYVQHVVFHHTPLLWRLHRMHHSDTFYDVSTALRFHPIEIGLSLLIKFSVVLLFGLAPAAVLIFEVILNMTAMFNHANLRLPLMIDRIFRWMIVTPDMHRVHHSVKPFETNSNYGFNLTWWDHLFKTYRDQPEDGHDEMLIGLNEFRGPAQQKFLQLLMQPFGSAKNEESA